MLILTRRVGEAIRIGDQICITVLGVKGNQVRLGTLAPREVEVHREEIYERIHGEPEPAARVKPEGFAACTICHVNWIDAADGFDTCDSCLAAQ